MQPHSTILQAVNDKLFDRSIEDLFQEMFCTIDKDINDENKMRKRKKEKEKKKENEPRMNGEKGEENMVLLSTEYEYAITWLKAGKELQSTR
jgi:hypothetical protein